MAKLIIALVGPIASGKGLSEEYICQKYQAKSFKFSSPLRSVLNTLGIEINRENMQNLSSDLRARFGKDLLARTVASFAIKEKAELVVIDGVRRMADISQLSKLDNFKLISIDASSKIRYQRVKMRNENVGDDKKSFKDFITEENRESEREIRSVMEKAHYRIINEADIPSLYRQIDNIFAKINTYGK